MSPSVRAFLLALIVCLVGRDVLADEKTPSTPSAPEYIDTAFGAAESTWINQLPSCNKAKSCSKPNPVTVRLTGFFQADNAWFNQDAANIAAVGTDIQDGADFRRARLAAAGNIYDNISYFLEMDFAFPGRPQFMDVQMTIHHLPVLGNLRIGQWRQPYGMDELTSVKELTFLERALPFAFAPFRQIGIGAYDTTADEMSTWAVSAFRYPTDPFGGNVGDNGGYGLAMRLTHLMWDNDYSLLHVGGDYSFADPSNDMMRYANQPEFAVIQGAAAPDVPPFVDTGMFPANNYSTFNAELAARLGSFYMQSEASYASVNQIGGPVANFQSFYAYAAYLLTGEVRPYNKQGGVFGRVRPIQNFGRCGGIGAWEVAGRWSYINLNDAGIAGGKLNNLTAGLNWYLNPNAKFQLNYIHAFLDRGGFNNTNADIAAMRVQVDF